MPVGHLSLWQLSDWMQPAENGLAPLPAASGWARPAGETPGLYSIDDLLKAGQGDSEFVVFMLQTFIESCEEALQQLQQGLHQADLTLLKGAAHTLKPSLQHLNAWQALPPIEKLNKWKGEFEADALRPLVDSAERLLGEMIAQITLDLKEERALTRVLAA